MEAVGMLEVYGCCAALAAVDAACKAATVRIDALDKNKPANADKLPVPLVMVVKMRGSVSDVEMAMAAAEEVVKSLTGVVSKYIIASPEKDTEKMLKIRAM